MHTPILGTKMHSHVMNATEEMVGTDRGESYASPRQSIGLLLVVCGTRVAVLGQAELQSV